MSNFIKILHGSAMLQLMWRICDCSYTADEDFLNADAVFDCIGDPPEERFDLTFCGSLLQKQFVS